MLLRRPGASTGATLLEDGNPRNLPTHLRVRGTYRNSDFTGIVREAGSSARWTVNTSPKTFQAIAAEGPVAVGPITTEKPSRYQSLSVDGVPRRFVAERKR